MSDVATRVKNVINILNGLDSMRCLYFISVSFFLLFSVFSGYAQSIQEPEPDYKNIGPWSCDLSPDLPYDPAKPNILVIGDSISQGYTPVLQAVLKEYNVIHNPCNAAYTGYTLQHIDKWLSSKEKWEAIIFNLGIWDLNTVPVAVPVYASRLDTITKKIIAATKNPIFVTTSKHPHPDKIKKAQMRTAALAIMTRYGVPIFDLELKSESESIENCKCKDLVHYTAAGSELIGKDLSNYIRTYLQRKKK